MGISEKLNQVTARHDELREILSSQNGLNSQDLQRLSRIRGFNRYCLLG